jgi:hypothetical protein
MSFSKEKPGSTFPPGFLIGEIIFFVFLACSRFFFSSSSSSSSLLSELLDDELELEARRLVTAPRCWLELDRFDLTEARLEGDELTLEERRFLISPRL